MEIIRKATLADSETIAANVVAMAYDARQVKLDLNIVREAVQNLFAKPELGFYLVSELNGRIAGSLMITFEWSDWRNGVYWWIGSVYVHPDFRRQGVYRRMHEFVRREAHKDPHARGLNLYVYKNNTTARKTYEQLGMKESNSVIYNAPEI